MSITVIGYDGSPLSDEARQTVAAADLLVGGARHLEAVGSPEGVEQLVLGPLDPALAGISEAHAKGRTVVVVASGDPGFFGIVRRLGEAGLPVTVLPARSCVSTAFAQLGLPWEDALIVSAHGRPLAPALNVLRRYGRGPAGVAVLTDADTSPAAIVAALGNECPDLHVFEHVGEPTERHTEISAHGLSRADAEQHPWEQPNLVVAGGVRMVGGQRWLGGPQVATSWALADEEFAHREGMLTKREVRAAVLARIAPAPGQLVWDIGAGSGSVGVECARLGAAVIAVEHDPEALGDIASNCEAHGVPVQVVAGKAPEVLEGLPHPDAAFVGGGGPDVVRAVAERRPQRVVVTLATVERLAPTLAALTSYDVETVLLQVQHLTPLGAGHRLAPANPVFVVSGSLR